MAFAYVWHYHVTESKVAEFEAAYGPDGAWARLFREYPGYLRTELLRDRENPHRYVTVDYWRSRRDYQAFRRAAATDFDRIDRACSELTLAEDHFGDFDTVETG